MLHGSGETIPGPSVHNALLTSHHIVSTEFDRMFNRKYQGAPRPISPHRPVAPDTQYLEAVR